MMNYEWLTAYAFLIAKTKAVARSAMQRPITPSKE
jgi:hypothetical protein